MDGREYGLSLSDSIEALRLKADYTYSETEGVVTKDRGSLAIHYDRSVSAKWKVWFFNIAKYNNVKEIRNNYLGAGPKYYILKGDHVLSFSTGVLYDYDHIAGEGHGRYSHRPKYAYKDIVGAVYYHQPSIKDPDDYIEKYEVNSIVPYTQGIGKVYCLKEYRSLIGTIEKECGLTITINFEGVGAK